MRGLSSLPLLKAGVVPTLICKKSLKLTVIFITPVRPLFPQTRIRLWIGLSRYMAFMCPRY
jgi:hypothetical protein